MSTWLEVILAFLEQSLKGIIKILMREIRHEDSEEELL